MDPFVLAKAHSGIAILVILFYFIRGGLMLASSVKFRIVLTAISHTFVLVLIFLGLYIAHLKGISFSNGFIITKISCLLVFIIAGTVALKQGLSKPVAIGLWLFGLATLVYAYLLGKHIVPAFL